MKALPLAALVIILAAPTMITIAWAGIADGLGVAVLTGMLVYGWTHSRGAL